MFLHSSWAIYQNICFIFALLFTQGQYWPLVIVVACVWSASHQSVRHQVCPCDNSSPVQARINLDHRSLPWLGSLFYMSSFLLCVCVCVCVWGGWPRTSRSNLTSKSKFTPFWDCPHDNSSPIQARATKFGPEVLNTLIKIPIVLGDD